MRLIPDHQVADCGVVILDVIQSGGHLAAITHHQSRTALGGAVQGCFGGIQAGICRSKLLCGIIKIAAKRLHAVKPYVDVALTFEELQALFDSRDIDITTLPEDVLDNASYYGRIFARSGGLADAVAQGLKERGHDDFTLNPVSCDGIEECRIALLKKNKNVLDANFVEGMACVGGCIGGAGCLTHGEKNKAEVDKYGREAYEKTISDAISVLKK